MKSLPGRLVILTAMCAAALSAVCAEPVVPAEPVLVPGRPLAGEGSPVSRVALDTPESGAATGLAGAVGGIANLSLATSGVGSFNDTFSLRGMANTPIFGDPAVTVYIDDIPLGSFFTTPTLLAGIGEVALHRGADQNTLFGRAGSAGVLELLTPSAPGDTATVAFGGGGLRRASAGAVASDGRGSQAYVAAEYLHRDGFLSDTTLGRRIDGREESGALARVRAEPASAVRLDLVAQAWRARDGEQPLVPLGAPMDRTARTVAGRTHIDAGNVGLTASIDAPWGRASATTSFNDWRLGPYLSVLSFGPAELLNDATVHQRSLNEELRLASRQSAEVRWSAGAYLSRTRTDGAFRRAFGPYVVEQSSYEIDGDAAAAFGRAEAALGGGWSAVAGLRVEMVRKTIDRAEQAPQADAYRLAGRSSALLPQLTLRHKAADGTEAYVSAQSGYKPGGYSAFTGNRSLSSFGPERDGGVEAGVSRAAAGGALQATVRGFWYDITGYQIERSFATGAATDDYLVVNAASARSAGAELELSWKATRSLALGAAAGLTRAELRRFTDPYTGVSYSGRTPPSVSPATGRLWFDWRGGQGWFAGASATFRGRTYFTEGEDLQFGQRAYVVTDASVGYDAGHWRVALRGANLGAVRAYSLISPGTGHGAPIDPRTWFVEATFRL